MTLKLLQEFVSLIIFENDDDDKKDRIKRSATPDDWRSNEDEAFEDRVEELRKQREFKTVDRYVNYKLDNDEYSFDASELQAISRNIDSERLGHRVNVASPHTVSGLKQLLANEYGFKFEPRQQVKHVRGSMSSAHGRHLFAGSGGGGSGFGSDRSGPSFTSFGGGPGAIGGGYAWDKDDKRNLRMGAGKKR